MKRISPTLRIAIGLASLGLSVYLASRSLGLGQDEWKARAQSRKTVCELIALQVSNHLDNRTGDQILPDLELIAQRNLEIESIGLRKGDELVAAVGEHANKWGSKSGSRMYLPIYIEGQPAGTVEICFADNAKDSEFFLSRSVAQLLFLLGASALLFAFYLKKMLKHLDPANVVPERVRSALDTFAEGLLVLDGSENIVLANSAFKKTLDATDEELQGKPATAFEWHTNEELPWTTALRDGQPQLGKTMDLVVNHRRITFMVNASPILSEKGKQQGILVSFDDVTLHEQRKRELEQTLHVLGESREQIRKQNQELKLLATRDPLTACMNRRAFFEEVENLWEPLAVSSTHLFVIMVDVDHFKAINDVHGHSAGDIVLKELGKSLLEIEASGATVCRFGGEEFCIVIERKSTDEARQFAEDINAVTRALRPAGLEITASLGVASSQDHDSFQTVLDLADRSLYVAKMRGRDRVVCYGDFTDEEFQALMDKKASTAEARKTDGPVLGIPFHAVSALLSALTYRDSATAEHSLRVADLCLRETGEVLSVPDQFVLETAALLHDIGKIGTPDVVLLKPGPHNDEEREIMSLHDFIGIEIIKTTFDNQSLVDIVANRCAWYGGHPNRPEMPTGQEIPLGSRILAICDAYDSLVTDLVYRAKTDPEVAFQELRRCAGTQFDPELVEAFIANIKSPTREPLSLGTAQVSKSAAREIGLLMTKITESYEAKDVTQLRHYADVLHTVAEATNLSTMATASSGLQNLVDDADLDEYKELVSTVLDLCRLTQRAYIRVSPESRARREELTRRVFST